MPSTQASIAAEVRAALARSRLRASDVAAALGCSPSNASRKIGGTVAMSAVDLVVIARLAGVPVADFFAKDVAVVAVPQPSAFAGGRGQLTPYPYTQPHTGDVA